MVVLVVGVDVELLFDVLLLVEVVVVGSSSDSVVRVVVLELRLGENELLGDVVVLGMREGAVVSVGAAGSAVVVTKGARVVDVTGAVVVLGPAVDVGMIPAMRLRGDDDVGGSAGVLAGSTR